MRSRSWSSKPGGAHLPLGVITADILLSEGTPCSRSHGHWFYRAGGPSFLVLDFSLVSTHPAIASSPRSIYCQYFRSMCKVNRWPVVTRNSCRLWIEQPRCESLGTTTHGDAHIDARGDELSLFHSFLLKGIRRLASYCFLLCKVVWVSYIYRKH